MKFDGNGSTLKFGANGTALIGINSISFPGESVAVIDATTLSNANVKTSIAANLRTVGDLTFNVDLVNLSGIPAIGEVTQATITLPDNYGTWTGWGYVSAIADSSLTNDASPTVDITFTVGNLNASGVETAPTVTVNAPAQA